MTARFGRNKRRAAREAVAAAQAEAEAVRALYLDTRRRLGETESAYARQRELIDEITDRMVRALGPHTALLPMELKQVIHTQGPMNPYEWRPVPDVDGIRAAFRDTPISIQAVSLEETRVRMLYLFAAVQERRYDMMRLVSFENVNEHKGVSERYYATSWDAVHRLGWRRDHVEYIAKQILTLQPRETDDAQGRTARHVARG